MIKPTTLKTTLFAVAIAGCASTTSSKPAPAPIAPSPVQTVLEPNGNEQKGKPEIGKWGFDDKGMDKSVKPGDSFYHYTDGGWLKNTKIPEDKSNFGMFTVLSDKSDERTRQIIDAAKPTAGGNEQKVADMYRSFMDEAAIEKAGYTPIKARLDEIAKLKDVAAFVAMSAQFGRENIDVPWGTAVQQDERQPDKYAGYLGQAGLGLPDRDMYDVKTKQFQPLRDAYKQYIGQLFGFVGMKDAEKRAAAVYAFEEKLANVQWTRIENRDPQKTYNKMTIAELEKSAPGVDWKGYLKLSGLGNETHIIVAQPSAITKSVAIVKATPIEVLRDYMAIRLISDAASFLSKQFVDARFALYGKTLSGTPQLKDRWKRGVDLVTGSLGEAVGQLYVEKYFTANTKQHADQLVKNLLVAMGQRLDGLTWMSAETKAKAKAKLATYNPKIGFPKKWRDYSAMKVVAGDPVGNATRAAQFEYDRQLAKLGKPVDKDEWGMTPMTVNAYYNPLLNEIVFPAAILQPPFFDAAADDAVNYGAIGAVIGHEISHGFDDQGAQYDETGTLKNWWTKDDNEKFKAATNKLVAQYDGYCPFPAQGDKPALCVKGALTLGENIADLAGLTVAYTAYHLSLGGKQAPVIDGLTGDQRFFLGFGQIWRRAYRDAELQNRLTTDVHSPSEYRVSVVRNLDAWYGAFKIDPKDKLFLAPDQRVKIW